VLAVEECHGTGVWWGWSAQLPCSRHCSSLSLLVSMRM